MKTLHPALNLLKIPVTDFKRACAWYRDVLGLEEEFAVEDYGWAQYKLGDPPIPLCLYAVGMGGGDGKPGHELNFHLAVDDAPKALAALKSKNAKIIGDLVASDDGGKFFILADPDNNTFKIVQRT